MHTLCSLPPDSPSHRFSCAARLFGLRLLTLGAIVVTGCSRFQHITHEYVYVAARQVYLHDRVAAVSNRVGLVTNGEALEVVEHGKRFTKVKTPKGEVGWLENHAIIDDKLFAQFEDLNKKHSADPVVATGELRDDLYLHVLPGRDTPHFLLVPGNAKIQFLERGTVAKTGPGMAPVAKPKPPIPIPVEQGTGVKPKTAPATQAVTKAVAPSVPVAPVVPVAPLESAAPSPVPMEDWWLVRDSGGHTGWLLAGRLDVDVPEEVGGYAEGQRMVGAYPIAKVMDSGVERKASKKSPSAKSGKAGKAAKDTSEDSSPEDASAPAPTVEHAEYVTVLTPHGGLPYDFDQLRVFTWSLNHHRYETGYRLHGIQGYLPVKLSQETVNGQTFPTFSFAIADGPDVTVDPDTGVTRPVHPRMLSFRLEGNLVRRTGADLGPIVLMHETGGEPGTGKAKAAAKKKKH